MERSGKKGLRIASVIIFWLLFLALAGLYFTNDFGLISLHKTSIIVAVGIDATQNEVQVTAQLAVPKPSQSGDNTQYSEVQGSGETVADALNEINVKTGYYPKLNFCKLILLGESCKEKNIFQMMGCFYRKNYSELTALVAMCSGSAAETLKMQTPSGDPSSTYIQHVISSELQKSANVSRVDLKDVAVLNFSKSAATYMPFIEPNVSGTSEEGGNGDNVGGDTPSQRGSQGGGGEQGGGSSSESGGSSGGGENGQNETPSQGKEEEKIEFTARRTALFNGGEYAGILNEQQSFALNLLENDIAFAILPCDAGKYHYTLGLKDAESKVKIKVEQGEVNAYISFKASAQISGIKKPVEPKETATDDYISREVKEGAISEIISRVESLIEELKKSNCDALGIRQKLYAGYPAQYEALSATALKNLRTHYKIEIKSAN